MEPADAADEGHDSRAKGFGEVSVELDAIEPQRLRDLVEDAIQRHLPPHQLDPASRSSRSERRLIPASSACWRRLRMARGKRATRTPKSEVEQFAKLIRVTMDTDAWRALSSSGAGALSLAQARVAREQYNNNGRIQLAVKEASKRLGVSGHGRARFHDLQAKGFLVMTKATRLGVEGSGATLLRDYRACPATCGETGWAKLYLEWRKGEDFSFPKVPARNPRGINKKQNLSRKAG